MPFELVLHYSTKPLASTPNWLDCNYAANWTFIRCNICNNRPALLPAIRRRKPGEIPDLRGLGVAATNGGNCPGGSLVPSRLAQGL